VVAVGGEQRLQAVRAAADALVLPDMAEEGERPQPLTAELAHAVVPAGPGMGCIDVDAPLGVEEAGAALRALELGAQPRRGGDPTGTAGLGHMQRRDVAIRRQVAPGATLPGGGQPGIPAAARQALGNIDEHLLHPGLARLQQDVGILVQRGVPVQRADQELAPVAARRFA
jgi:hypothetical protein